MEKALNILKALSDNTRISILNLISNRRMCSRGLARHLGISEAAISQQIKILKDCNLIIAEKRGYHVLYKLNRETLDYGIEFIQNIRNGNETQMVLNINECRKNCKHKKCFENNLIREDLIMKVCFPVKNNEGLKSVPYGHFGTAPQFIVCDTESGEVKTINNGDMNHEHGKCQPIKALTGEVVDAVVVGGIGQGAISKLNSMGIRVYMAVDGNIEENLSALKDGKLKEFASNHVCNHDECAH